MTWAELERKLVRESKCRHTGERAGHSELTNLETGKKFTMGRHASQEVPKEALNKSRRAPDGSFSVMLRQSALDVALLRLRALFLA